MDAESKREGPADWWYQAGDGPRGPISYGTLLALFASGAIEEQTSVRQGDAKPWRPLVEIANNRVAACQQFVFVCSKRWDDLATTASEAVRHCGECQKNVYRCESRGELKQHALLGHCAALCVPDEDIDLLGYPLADDDDQEGEPSDYVQTRAEKHSGESLSEDARIPVTLPKSSIPGRAHSGLSQQVRTSVAPQPEWSPAASSDAKPSWLTILTVLSSPFLFIGWFVWQDFSSSRNAADARCQLAVAKANLWLSSQGKPRDAKQIELDLNQAIEARGATAARRLELQGMLEHVRQEVERRTREEVFESADQAIATHRLQDATRLLNRYTTLFGAGRIEEARALLGEIDQATSEYEILNSLIGMTDEEFARVRTTNRIEDGKVTRPELQKARQAIVMRTVTRAAEQRQAIKERQVAEERARVEDAKRQREAEAVAARQRAEQEELQRQAAAALNRRRTDEERLQMRITTGEVTLDELQKVELTVVADEPEAFVGKTIATRMWINGDSIQPKRLVDAEGNRVFNGAFLSVLDGTKNPEGTLRAESFGDRFGFRRGELNVVMQDKQMARRLMDALNKAKTAFNFDAIVSIRNLPDEHGVPHVSMIVRILETEFFDADPDTLGFRKERLRIGEYQFSR